MRRNSKYVKRTTVRSERRKAALAAKLGLLEWSDQDYLDNLLYDRGGPLQAESEELLSTLEDEDRLSTGFDDEPYCWLIGSISGFPMSQSPYQDEEWGDDWSDEYYLLFLADSI